MEINYFDIAATVIILFLGLKGIINGFFKEVFGLIGIIGGIFVASRVGSDVGNFLNDLIFKFENNSAISFTGFLLTLAAFWLLMVIVGQVFKQLSSLSGLGAIDKILGFVFGASKFFLIASVIIYATYNIKALKSTLDETNLKNSILIPIFIETGSFIMKLDPAEISQDINSTASSLKESANELIDKSTQKMAQESIKELQEPMQEAKK